MSLYGADADRGSSGGEVWERHNAERLRKLAEKRREQRKRSGKEGRKMEKVRGARMTGREAGLSGDSLQEVARAIKAVLAIDEIYNTMVRHGYKLPKEQWENSVRILRRRGRFPDVSFASGGGEEDLRKAGRMILEAIEEVRGRKK